MRWLFVLLALGAGASGCRDEAHAQLEAVHDELCACTTAECGEEALSRLPATPSTDHRAKRVAREMMDCLQKLRLKRPDDPAHDHTAPAPAAPAIESTEGTPGTGVDTSPQVELPSGP